MGEVGWSKLFFFCHESKFKIRKKNLKEGGG